MEQVTRKYLKLLSYLEDLEKVAVAFSGGIDSTFLLNAAVKALGNKNVIAITFYSSMHTVEELEYAKKFAKDLYVEHIILNIDIEDIESINKNDKNRCYTCKKYIFSKAKDLAIAKGINILIDGTNIDDIKDYRPGLKALEELEVISPLKENNINKQEVRILSKHENIDIWDKPSSACLASRIPYGTKLTKENLNQVKECEKYLKNLNIDNCRVRNHGEIARIEVSEDNILKLLDTDVKKDIIDFFKKQGFIYICIDLEGYKVGSMNNLIDESRE